MKMRTLLTVSVGIIPALLAACSSKDGSTKSSSALSGGAKPIVTMGTVSAKQGPRAFAGTASANDLSYYGGPVISNVKIYTVFWGAGSDTFQSDLATFFTDITSSPYIDNLAQYSTSTQKIGRGSFAGAITDTNALPGTTIDDTQIAAELANLVAAGTVPPNDGNNLYFFYFPAGVTITLQGSASCQAFCGYHSTTTIGGSDAFYAVIPDLDPTTCTGCAVSGQTQLQSTTEVSSHEMSEAITDPGIGLDLTDPSFPENPVAWYNTSLGEVGDICAWQPTTLPDGYTVQLEWSNAAGACTATPATTTDAGTDTGSDAAKDSGVDTGTDSGMDAGPTNLVVNGGFETGDLTGWTLVKGKASATSSEAHGGAFAGLIGSTSGYHGVTDLTQNVTIPSTGTTTLSFWGVYVCAGADAKEYERVRVLNAAGHTLKTVVQGCVTDGTWTQSTLDLTKYAGQTVTLQFVGDDDKVGLAYYVIDDVSVTNQ